MVRWPRMSTVVTRPVKGTEDTDILSSKIAKIRPPRFKRRGSLLRRAALERVQQGNAAESAVVEEGADYFHGEGKCGVDGRGALVGDVQLQQRPVDGTYTDADAPPPPRGKVAWGDVTSATPRVQRQPSQRRRSSTIDAKATNTSPDAHGQTDNPQATASSSRTSSAGRKISVFRKQRKENEVELRERAEMLQGRRTSRRRESALRQKELEQTAVDKVEGDFKKLYVPPLGPLDDPPGVIYLDGDLTEKTVDIRFLDSLGEDVLVARKELFDIGTRRRSLVEEIKSQNRRVSLGFPRNPEADAIHNNRVEEADNVRRKAEGKLHRLLEYRRRLLDVLQASQDNEERSLPTALALAEAPMLATDAVGGVDHAERPRRSSFDHMKELAKELMAREPSQETVYEATGSRRPSDKRRRSSGELPTAGTGAPLENAETRRMQRRLMNQGWREVFEAVFAEAGERRRHVVSFGQGSAEDDRERKESNIRGFMAGTSPREHMEFLVAAMNPARAKDLPLVVKCVLLHYTGPGADELDLLLGGRMGATEAQVLTEMTLSALDELHADYVSPVLMLQWLLARAPHLRALLLRGGVLRRAFRRLQSIDAKEFGSGEKAIQYGALSLVVGVLFA